MSCLFAPSPQDLRRHLDVGEAVSVSRTSHQCLLFFCDAHPGKELWRRLVLLLLASGNIPKLASASVMSQMRLVSWGGTKRVRPPRPVARTLGTRARRVRLGLCRSLHPDGQKRGGCDARPVGCCDRRHMGSGADAHSQGAPLAEAARATPGAARARGAGPVGPSTSFLRPLDFGQRPAENRPQAERLPEASGMGSVSSRVGLLCVSVTV